jgi:hypothetical protein
MDKKDVTLFTFLNQIQSKRKTIPYDKKIASAYMLSMWMSHDKGLIGKVNEINRFQFLLPDDIIYSYYMDTIPAGKRYIKWVKKRKTDSKLKKRIEKLQKLHSELSVRECKMIIGSLECRTKLKK